MTKKEVIEQKLEDYVLHDDDEVQTFGAWWKTVDSDEVVEVQYPHERHGLAGKVSNHSKQQVMAEFLEFVDSNSQPNGRQAGSYSAQFFFLPKFTRIAAPREREKNFDEKAKSSLVAEFNRVQTEMGRQTCGSTAASEWLQRHRNKVALHPSMTDYCATCKYLKEQLSRNQAITNRAQQSGSTPEGEMRALETSKEDLEEELRQHKDVATKSREYYKASTDKCRLQWSDITQLTSKSVLSRNEREELERKKHSFTLTISADYQQSKLVPSWGKTEQPGSTYYLQKVSHDIFGIVDHSSGKSTVYVFDEHIGPKNTDHTVSFLTHYWRIMSQQYSWIRRWSIFLDNATSTNKNRFLFAWAMEMVSSGEVDHIHFSFMIAGHTKFAPDHLFSITGSAYKVQDVFNIEDLKAICDKSATTYIEQRDRVHTWRDSVGKKYSDLPGVRKLHDFLVVKAHDGRVVMKVHEHCYSGDWKESPLHVRDHSASGIPTTTYAEKHYHGISAQKMADMVTMYNRYISPDCRPQYIQLSGTPTTYTSVVSATAPSSASCSVTATSSSLSTTARTSTTSSSSAPSMAGRKRRQSKCSTEGCDGTGHKNPARWTEGHTTRAGCPQAHK